jgi:hypothetical protein
MAIAVRLLTVALALVLAQCHRPIAGPAGGDAGVKVAPQPTTRADVDAGHRLGSYYPDPIVDIGGSTGQINVGTLQWPSSQAAPKLTQSTTSSATGANLVVCEPQASTATNGTPGNCAINLDAPTGAGTYGMVQINAGGTLLGQIGPWANTNTQFGIWGPANPPTTTNYSLYAASTATQLNAVTNLIFLIGNAELMRAVSGGIQLFDPTGAHLGGGAGVLGMANATTVPTTSAAGKGQFYASNAGGNSELFWRDSANNVYQITPPAAGPTTTTITATGTFTPTATGFYMAEGCGGGGGGGGGGAGDNGGHGGTGGGGGGGAQKTRVYFTIASLSGITVTIGTGGTGTTSSGGTKGNDGADTTVGSLATLAGAMSGFGGGTSGNYPGGPGGADNRNAHYYLNIAATPTGSSPVMTLTPVGWGNWGGNAGAGNSSLMAQGSNIDHSFADGTAAAAGTGANSGGGGGGGAAGAYGAGANGGAGQNGDGTGGSAGANAAANTCAGGGGGGGGRANTATSGGAGGNGGSGQVSITGPL